MMLNVSFFMEISEMVSKIKITYCEFEVKKALYSKWF